MTYSFVKKIDKDETNDYNKIYTNGGNYGRL